MNFGGVRLLLFAFESSIKFNLEIQMTVYVCYDSENDGRLESECVSSSFS